MSGSSDDIQRSPLQQKALDGELGNWSQETWGKLDAYVPKLRQFVSRRDPENASDITQQVLVAVMLASRKGLDEPTYVPAYLQRIASNQMNMRHRKETDRKTGEPRVYGFSDSADHDNFLNNAPARNGDPVARLQLDEIQREVDKMPPAYREVFDLCLLQGNDQKRTAEMTGLTVAAVKANVHRIRERLREQGLGTGLVPAHAESHQR